MSHRLVERGQYTSLAFTEALAEVGITGLIGTVGDALGNAFMELTIGLFKTEAIKHEQPVWSGSREVEKAVVSWVHWHNREGLHSSIGTSRPSNTKSSTTIYTRAGRTWAVA